MPTLLNANEIRFFFYSNENSEPIHVHVAKGDAVGKLWLMPKIEIVYLYGFTRSEEKLILELVELNIDKFKLRWNEHFSE